MLLKLVSWARGSRDYKVTAGADTAADILTASGANFTNMHRDGDVLTFTLPLSICPSVEAVFSQRGVAFEAIKEHGFVPLFLRYKRRYGIAIGALIFVVLLFLSEKFIWSVEIIGNDEIPDAEIIERLDALGCGVGAYIPSIDFDWLHNQFLLDGEGISWISVNLHGTHAAVEVRELVPPATDIDESVPYNLVASEDGIVEYIEVLRGEKIAREEELVREGELLASGVQQMKHGLRLVHARGTVLARVKRSIKVEIPFESTVREYTGREFSEKYLNFFDFSLKIFANTSNLPEKCDKIEREAPLRFFDAVTVPVNMYEVIYREYADVPVTISEDEAKSAAYEKMREECAKIAEDAELISREIKGGVKDGAYVIECELTVLKNIAKEVPIYTSN